MNSALLWLDAWTPSLIPSNKKSVAAILKSCLDQNNLINAEIGTIYMSDHVQSNGKIAESALDHVYHSKKMDNIITMIKPKHTFVFYIRFFYLHFLRLF